MRSLFLCCLFLCACARSSYIAPHVDIPDTWLAQQGQSVAPASFWWEQFQDSVLDSLIQQALQANADLAAAGFRLQAARLQAGLTAAALRPGFRAGGEKTVQRDMNSGQIRHSYAASVQMSYELDLWGKLRAAQDAARWEARATAADLEKTRIALVSSVVETYWRIGSLHERLALAQGDVLRAEKMLSLTRARHTHGAVSGLALAQAERALIAQRKRLPEYRHELAMARMTLSLLCDAAPEKRMPEAGALPRGEIAAPVPDLPASVLRRRPDVRAAELRLRAFLARVDEAQTALYPALSLTGSYGGSSAELLEILANPVGSLGVGFVLPFLEWPSKLLAVDLAENEYAAAIRAFRHTLYTALQEVEGALSAQEKNVRAKALQKKVLENAQQVESLTRARYDAGGIALQEVLEARDAVSNAEDALVSARLACLLTHLDLLKASGGPVFGVKTQPAQPAGRLQ